MADNERPVEGEQPAPPQATKKRKRKTELEQLIGTPKDNDNNTGPQVEENPWTDRENLELLRLHRDLHSHTKPDQMVEALNSKMSRIRNSSRQAAKPARTAKEFMSQVRDLKKLQDSDDMIEELEQKFERPEPPKKKRKAPIKKTVSAEDD